MKCFWVIFCVLDENLTWKHASHHQNPKFWIWPFLTSWHWMTMSWRKVTKDLGEYLEVSQTRYTSFNRLYFNMIRPLFPAKRTMTDNKKLTFDPICDVISDVQTKFCNIFGKVKPGAIKCCFRIENWSISLADSRGPKQPAPPPSAGRVREYPIGARVNVVVPYLIC